jgi:hypothetical protein
MAQKIGFFRSANTVRFKEYIKQGTKCESVTKLQDKHAVKLWSNDHV